MQIECKKFIPSNLHKQKGSPELLLNLYKEINNDHNFEEELSNMKVNSKPLHKKLLEWNKQSLTFSI